MFPITIIDFFKNSAILIITEFFYIRNNKMENKSNLTNEELSILKITTDLSNAYNKLEEQQPSDKEEF